MTGTTGTAGTHTATGAGTTLGTDTAAGTIRGITDIATVRAGMTHGTLQAGMTRGITATVWVGMTHGITATVLATAGLLLHSLTTASRTTTFITVTGTPHLHTMQQPAEEAAAIQEIWPM